MKVSTKDIIKRKFKIALPFLIYAVAYMLYFMYLERTDLGGYYVPYCHLDSVIPFVPYFVVPYFLWFLFVPFVVVVLLLDDEELYRRTSRDLMIGMTIFLFISTAFPTKLYLRPQITGAEASGNIFYKIVEMLYSTDTPTNVFPSIHVFNTCAVQGGIYMSRRGIFTRKWVRITSSLLSVLIILAAMFLKQHSVVDVIGAFVMYGGIYFTESMFKRRSGQSLENFREAGK